MILKEVEHVWLQIPEELPASCNAYCRLPEIDRHSVVIDIFLDNAAQCVVETGLIVKEVESYASYIFIIKVLLIYLCDEYDRWIFFLYLSYQPLHE